MLKKYSVIKFKNNINIESVRMDCIPDIAIGNKPLLLSTDLSIFFCTILTSADLLQIMKMEFIRNVSA